MTRMLTTSLELATIAAILAVAATGCKTKMPDKKGAAPATSAEAQKKAEPKKVNRSVLLVHSYHAEYPWVASISSGAQDELKKHGIPFETFYMDTKRKTDDGWKEQSGKLARKKLDEMHPGVVITSDDNAQQFFAKELVGSDTAVVFCGVNADPSKYGFPAANVTGVLERPNLSQTLELLARVKPIQTFALLSSDDETSVGAINFMKQGSYGPKLVETKLVSSFDDWKAAVKELNGKVDALGVYMYHTIKRAGSAESMDPKEVMAWTRDNVTIPTIGFFPFGIEDGLLLGAVESGEEHGTKAALYAVKILDGAAPSSLPVLQADVGTKTINRDTAKKLGITLDEAKLPGVTFVEAPKPEEEEESK